ncbi:hypothetical protein BD410DRAFT_829522 [Rickenella mellea]|uniref:DNA/RNA-binding domain-containing protein n=1 Tax=Rickenella mellea TaxID=50990 RepID=A0A4Y7PZY8_9AGAM|nr:hypothetical protein BD410DRAFT_829522 [Rickenella mellea]
MTIASDLEADAPIPGLPGCTVPTLRVPLLQFLYFSPITNPPPESKGFSQDLKESVRSREPWDREVEFQRRNLRALQLKLLLLHPYSKESKDVETHLWMQTSYQFIASYKQRITALDRKLFSPHNQKRDARQDHANGGGGHQDYRRILSRFRQFLAEEEKFWMQLLVRFSRLFGLHEAQAALLALEIIPEDAENASKGGDSGRNIFPPEDGDPGPTPQAQRDSRLAIFSKCLVCLGDIARYREQYNESGGRPRAGHEDGFSPRKAGRGGKRGGGSLDAIPRPRNYTRAQTCYEHARLLVPDDGNASHQLAILASYHKDTFGSLLHYYRALCVRVPYDTASDNLNTVLKKGWEAYKAKKESKIEGVDSIPRLQVERFKEWVVVLHALWVLDGDESATKATKHAKTVISEFSTLVSNRVLPTDTISKVITLAVGALWKLRMIRDPSVKKDIKRDTVVEPLIAAHILDLFRTLLDIGYAQVQLGLAEVQAEAKEPMANGDVARDLAQRITAEFRRMLPALRIASKWLRSNFSYLSTAPTSFASSTALATSLSAFWGSYALFCSRLFDTFPKDRLPRLTSPLEEDVEMTGFSPIKKGLFAKAAPGTDDGLLDGQSQVHPNEEFLMRISDVLIDAACVAEMEKSPISFRAGKFALRDLSADTGVPMDDDDNHNLDGLSASAAAALASPPVDSLATIMESHPDPPRAIRDSDDDNTTQTSRTDDDPVRDAFRAALGGPVQSDVEDEVEEEDEIVWDPRASLSPLAKAIQPPLPSPPALTAMHNPNQNHSPLISPPRRPPPLASTSTTTTAQDLLNNVLGLGLGLGLPRTSSDLQRHSNANANAESSAPQASLLFGSGSPSAPTTSIWTSMGMGVERTPGAGQFAASSANTAKLASPLMQAQQHHHHQQQQQQQSYMSVPVPAPIGHGRSQSLSLSLSHTWNTNPNPNPNPGVAGAGAGYGLALSPPQPSPHAHQPASASLLPEHHAHFGIEAQQQMQQQQMQTSFMGQEGAMGMGMGLGSSSNSLMAAAAGSSYHTHAERYASGFDARHSHAHDLHAHAGHGHGHGSEGFMPLTDTEYHMPYHVARDPRLNPVFNTYIPPIQRAWNT